VHDDDKRPRESADGPSDSVTTKPAEPTDDVVATRHQLPIEPSRLQQSEDLLDFVTRASAAHR